jgi:phosphate butyryltransferase
METISNFGMLRERLLGKEPVQVVAVEANDEHSQWAIHRAEEEGWAKVINIQSDSVEESAQRAVRMVREGKAQAIMKGIVNTDVVLRAVLNKEEGLLPKGNVITHIAAMKIPCYHKLLFVTDVAVIPYPTLEQRKAMINYAITLCKVYGIEQPKVALLHCTEKVSPKFPITEDYVTIIEECRNGLFGNTIIDGPIDLKCAIDKEAALIKKLDSPVAGDSDVLVMPDIQAGNVFYKTITTVTDAELAVGLQGAACPISITSRSDSALTKFNSLAMACSQVRL